MVSGMILLAFVSHGPLVGQSRAMEASRS
jgi:hypothetical protein